MVRKKLKLMKRTVGALMCLLLFAAGTSAQNKTISGTIYELDGEPAIGATVMVKGTGIGTAADMDGKYSLSVPEDATMLVVSYSGMATQEVPITGNIIDVNLQRDAVANELDEVVAIGYATVKRRDLTGTVSSVGANELKDVPVISAAEAIAGKMAGVQVTTTEGSPDADVKIRVRGGGSITGDNTPLYIVDGFPVSSISDIPPSEIKSIDVLKDASATAIYGSQGANGVIIITTKGPSEDGKFSANYDAYIGWKKITKKLDVLNPGDYVRWQYERQAMAGSTAVKDRFSRFFNEANPTFALADYDADEYDRVMSLYQGMSGTNWQDEIFGNTGSTQNQNISLNGGSQAASFQLNYTRINDNAIMLGSDYKQDNLSFKLNSKPLKWLRVNMQARYSDTKVNGSGANDVNSVERSTQDSRLKHTVIYTPIPIRNYASDTAELEEEEVGNLYPPDIVVFDNWKQTRKRIYSYNGNIQATLMKGLVFRTELGLYNTQSDVDRYYGPTSYYSRTISFNDNAYQEMGIATMATTSTSRFRNANTLTFEKKNINKSGHSFNVMLGEETVITKSEVKELLVAGLADDVNYRNAFELANTGLYSQVNNVYYYANDRLLSFFGRLNYDYKDKYLLTVTMRADGSSKFAEGNRWGYFPAAALAWRASDEEFLSNADWLSNLKLRLSYGTVGNDKILSTQYMTQYTAQTSAGYMPEYTNTYYSAGNYMTNPDLKWETTITRNIGLDFGFLKNRISGTVDAYLNSTKDLLLELDVTGVGYTKQFKNIGSTQNKGIELTLNGIILDKKNYGLDISANVAFNRNKVKELDGRDEMFYSSGWIGSTLRNEKDYIVRVGEPLGQMYGYVTEGRYDADDFMWNGTSWVMNDAKYINQHTLEDGTVVYTDASGNSFVNNSTVAGNSWGPGALKLADLDGDGQITEADQKVIGNANPKAAGGFTINARAYGFDLSANFTWMYGNKIYNANKIEFTSTGLESWYGRNMISEMANGNRWTNIDPATGQLSRDTERLAELNAGTTLWSPSMSNLVFHSWAVEDGSFLRLASLTLGYTLPKDLIKKVYLQNLRFYVSAGNLFCLTNYSGYDPEVDTRRKTNLTPGVDYSAYPKSRSFNIGVNIGF